MNLKEFILIFLLALAIIAGFFSSLVWLVSREWSAVYLSISVVVILVDIILVAWAAFSLTRYRKLWKTPVSAGALKPEAAPKEEIRSQWEQIKKLADSKNPSEWNMAVLRADALLDTTMQNLGYEGEDFAERLKVVDPGRVKALESVWSSHRLRNMIAHEPLEQHPHDQILLAIQSYEQALKELDMME